MCECRIQLRMLLDPEESKPWHFEYLEQRLHFITVVFMGVKTRFMITKAFIISIIVSFKDPLISSLAMADHFMRWAHQTWSIKKQPGSKAQMFCPLWKYIFGWPYHRYFNISSRPIEEWYSSLVVAIIRDLSGNPIERISAWCHLDEWWWQLMMKYYYSWLVGQLRLSSISITGLV